MGVIRVTAESLVLEEIAPGVTIADIQRATEPKLLVREPVKVLAIPELW
jgi:acyl CoA:acetate/3-ketoacid CoA transferase beta subunit